MATAKVCLVCGIEFPIRKHKETIYCSHKCAAQARAQNTKDPSKHAVFTCKQCGKEFETWAYRNPTVCSRKCAAYMGGAVGGRPRVDGYRVIKQCVICGKDYETNIKQIQYRGSTCCSHACVAIRQSQIKRGIGNPNFRGGTIKGRGSSWSSARKKALKRDGYKCRVCGKKISRFKHDYGVHHITPYRNFHGDHVKANELSNLITLCRSCHGKAEGDKIYVQRALF